MEYKDYYKTLGVNRDAPQDEIKRAYRRLARKYHPDVSKERDAEDRFKELQEAYEVLKDGEKRAAYDQLGRNWRAGQEFRPPPGWEPHFQFRTAGGPSSQFSDFFEQLFGGSAFGFGGHGRGHSGSSPGSRARSSQQPPQELELEITLEEAFQGSTRTIQLQMPAQGLGARANPTSRTLNVRIPAGVTAGQKIRLQGQGGSGLPGAPASDLYLKISIQAHPTYRVEGKDIHLEVPVSPWEAALGAKVEVPTPGGKLALSIPERSQSGRRMRLRGRGLPGANAGDLYVTLKIVNPPIDSQRTQELYRKLSQEIKFDPRENLRA